MTLPESFQRSVGKRSSRVVHTHDVAGSNPAAATNPAVQRPGDERETGRKRLCTPADPSVRNVFHVAQGVVLSLLRTRRDASPPGSGGSSLGGSMSCGPPFLGWTLRS